MQHNFKIFYFIENYFSIIFGKILKLLRNTEQSRHMTGLTNYKMELVVNITHCIRRTHNKVQLNYIHYDMP